MPYLPNAKRSSLPLPAEGRGSVEYWLSQIQSAEEKRNDYRNREWDRNVQSYLGKTLDVLPAYDTITVPKDFANVERKKAELFFQLPDVHLAPKLPGLEDAVHIFQAVINHKLGPAGVDAGAMMAETTFDALMTGLLVSKIGYESFEDGMVEVQNGEREAQPAQPLPGQILGLGAQLPPQMEPILEQVPNIVYERYYWQRISPARVLIPQEFAGFNYDQAPWLGFEFEEDWEIIKSRYNLPDDLDVKTGSTVQNRLKSEQDPVVTRTDPKRVRGWEIWYKTSLFDNTIVHPEHQRYLVLIEGVEESVRHTDSPYQEWNGQVLTGLIGFPVHIGSVRYVSDSAYPIPETTLSRAQVQELSKSRTQMLLQRDRNVPMRWADPARIGGESTLEKFRRNIWQSIIPIPGAEANNLPIGEVPRSSYPPEDFTFNNIIERDLNEVWAFGPNQRGLETAERKTATEIRNIQANVSARLDYERRQIIRYFVSGVRKLGALIQKFADQQDYVEIVGPQGERRLQAWNKDVIRGEFVYDAKPDSAVRLDAAQEFRDTLEFYNLAAKDPHVNRIEILTKLARLRNLDPTRFLVPQLPERKPEPPKAAFSFKGEDMDPRNPAFPIVLELLLQAGYKISPEAVQAAQQHAAFQQEIMNTVGAAPEIDATHPGAQPQADRVSKHMSERTHELSGPSSRPQE